MSKQLPTRNEPYVIGLTGNIATGKSTVAKMLACLGAEIIDADAVTHQVMRSGTPVWQEIVDGFGREILQADGEIDRAKLGAMVFADPEALRTLEEFIHPAVIAQVGRRIAEIAGQATQAGRKPIIVVEAIKLIESGMTAMCDSLWVVICPFEQQMKRLQTRSGLTAAESVLRIQAQPSPGTKIALADVVIDNGGDLSETWYQVQREWNTIGSK